MCCNYVLQCQCLCCCWLLSLVCVREVFLCGNPPRAPARAPALIKILIFFWPNIATVIGVRNNNIIIMNMMIATITLLHLRLLVVASVLLIGSTTSAFSLISSIPSRPTNTKLNASFLDFLKWGGSEPDFDVLEKTKQYVQEEGYISFNLKKIPADFYDERYVFRGPIVGPISRKDLVETNTQFGLDQSFPDLKREPFGLSVDPENPYRVLFFERWKATHTGDFNLLGLIRTDASHRKSISPAFPFSITWTPEGKIIYECLSTAVDRFEGNTKGKVAVFGLLETAGLPIDNSVGNPFLAMAQKMGRALNLPAQTYSREENIPSWWKSSAMAADPNDM